MSSLQLPVPPGAFMSGRGRHVHFGVQSAAVGGDGTGSRLLGRASLEILY